MTNLISASQQEYSGREKVHYVTSGLLKAVAGFTLFACLVTPPSAVAQDMKIASPGPSYSISAGVISAPAFMGDDDFKTNLIPNLSVSYGDFFKASLSGIEYVAMTKGAWRFGTLVAYDFGREESLESSPFTISDKPSNDLLGMGDIDGTLELGGFVQYKLRSFDAKLKLYRGIDGGHEGFVGDATVSHNGQFSAKGLPLFYSVGPSVSFGDASYNNTFFGVSDSQSAASGLSRYDAGSGVNSIGIKATAIMPLSIKTSIIGFIQYDQLMGDAKDSSLVIERGSKDQSTVGLLFNYKL